jgi:hypothetical protein
MRSQPDMIQGENGSKVTSSPYDGEGLQNNPKDDASTRAAKSAPRAYVLSRKIIYNLAKGGAKSMVNHGYRRLLAMRRRHVALEKNVIWRDDMDEFVLDLMRRRITAELLQLSKVSESGWSQYLTPCAAWDDIKRLKHTRGCILWYSPTGNDLDSPAEGPKSSSKDTDPELANHASSDEITASYGSDERISGEFTTLDLEGVKYWPKIPVYNLGYLLGEQYLQQLREGSSIIGGSSLVMLARRRTVPTQMRLWKLQGYLALYGEVFDYNTQRFM